MQLKIPWIDRRKCVLRLDCKAADSCGQDAIKVRDEGPEAGIAEDIPVIDLESCKNCADCEKACPENAIKMI